MVVRFAPRVTWFKQKRPLRSDYFSPKPDKVVPESGPKSGPVRSYTTVFAWFIGNLREILVPRRGVRCLTKDLGPST